MTKSERQTSTFVLSKTYTANFSMFERLLIESDLATTYTKKVAKLVTKRKGPSISQILLDRKNSECPVLMGINKFVFVLEYKKGKPSVSL